MTKRVAIFASYSETGSVDDHVLYCLRGLKAVANHIVFVSDNELSAAKIERIKPLVTSWLCERHGEYDFGSYKRGFHWARHDGMLDGADELILCNDSCFGPLDGFKRAFSDMEARRADWDFWGMTESNIIYHHLQSYFLVFGRNAFQSATFADFLANVGPEKSVRDVIVKYEIGLTQAMKQAGFRPQAFVRAKPEAPEADDPASFHIEHFPRFLMRQGMPLVKVKALHKPNANLEGIDRTLADLREVNPELYAMTVSRMEVADHLHHNDTAFSVIMATRDRRHCIDTAIQSVLAQIHENFELIIVDDGSTDGTGEHIAQRYTAELSAGRIIYVPLAEQVGVSAARNAGLEAARHPWIAYVDSDNRVRPHFLSVFAAAIASRPGGETFYAQCRHGDGSVVGRVFDYKRLLAGNYIDLGVFVHSRECYERWGGFDPELHRLVDWDLILRYVRWMTPAFVNSVVMDYDNSDRPDRISSRGCALTDKIAVQRRHSDKPVVTTVIVCRNHATTVARAIKSALSQQGDFFHEIIVADDASTDGSVDVIRRYVEWHPTQVRAVFSSTNLGLSKLWHDCACTHALGDYAALLVASQTFLRPTYISEVQPQHLNQVSRMRERRDIVNLLAD